MRMKRFYVHYADAVVKSSSDEGLSLSDYEAVLSGPSSSDPVYIMRHSKEMAHSGSD